MYFVPFMLYEMYLHRDDLIAFYDVVPEQHKNAMGILMALNKIYHPGKVKWMDKLIDEMSIFSLTSVLDIQ
jgi:hypothetical protein